MCFPCNQTQMDGLDSGFIIIIIYRTPSHLINHSLTGNVLGEQVYVPSDESGLHLFECTSYDNIAIEWNRGYIWIILKCYCCAKLQDKLNKSQTKKLYLIISSKLQDVLNLKQKTKQIIYSLVCRGVLFLDFHFHFPPYGFINWGKTVGGIE